MAVINQINRIVGNYRDEKCPECKHEYQTGSQSEMSMPYCGDCGKIVLDATQNFCCWCGCKFREVISESEPLKAITELAVKGLESIKQMLDMDHSGYQKYLIWKLAFDTLEEIGKKVANEINK